MEYKQTSYMQLNKYNIPHRMYKRKLHKKTNTSEKQRGHYGPDLANTGATSGIKTLKWQLVPTLTHRAIAWSMLKSQ